MTAVNDDIDMIGIRILPQRQRGEIFHLAEAMTFAMPCKCQSTGGREPDANSGETSRTNIDQDLIRLTFVGQSRNKSNELFRMAATDYFMMRG